MVITSLENEKIKKYAKLKEKKYRDMYQEFIVEGEHLVLEAYKNNLIKEIILLNEEKLFIDFPNVVYVSLPVMKKITNLVTPPRVCALCKYLSNSSFTGNKYLLLDNIQDPGNLGTIIRSAVAFNIDTIVLSHDTVDMYNTKVLRATQGMLFHINIVRGDIENSIHYLKNNNIAVYTTDVCDGIDARNLSLEEKKKFALLVGNEGSGVNKKYASLCDKKIYINTNNKVESLNVSVATSILLYEFGRE